MRFTDKIATREGKIKLLITYWDKLAFEITKKVANNRDAAMNNFVM